MQIITMPEYFKIEKSNSFTKLVGFDSEPYHVKLRARQRQNYLLAEFGYDRNRKIKTEVGFARGTKISFMGVSSVSSNNKRVVPDFSMSEIKFKYNKLAGKMGGAKMRKMIKPEPKETKLGYLLRLKKFGIYGKALEDLIQEEMEYQEYKKKNLRNNERSNNSEQKSFSQLNGITMVSKDNCSDLKNNNSNSRSSETKR